MSMTSIQNILFILFQCAGVILSLSKYGAWGFRGLIKNRLRKSNRTMLRQAQHDNAHLSQFNGRVLQNFPVRNQIRFLRKKLVVTFFMTLFTISAFAVNIYVSFVHVFRVNHRFNFLS